MEPEECSENWMINSYRSLNGFLLSSLDCLSAPASIGRGTSTFLHAFDKYDMHTQRSSFEWLHRMHIRISVVFWNVCHLTLFGISERILLAKELCLTVSERTEKINLKSLPLLVTLGLFNTAF
jgi:hypothetical protein